MKEKQNIERTLRLLFLSKSLYYSVLWLILSFVAAVLVIGINQIFIPKLSLIRSISILTTSLSFLFFLGFPLRFILGALFTPWLHTTLKARLLKQYDGGLLGQYAELSQGGELDKWSASKLFIESSELLKLQLPSIKKDWNVKAWRPFLMILGLLVLFIPTKFWKENTKEIVQGKLRVELVNEFDFKDTVVVNYGDNFDLIDLKSNSYGEIYTQEKVVILKDTTMIWVYKGREVGYTFIDCDSVSTLEGWQATVSPPAYLKMNSYTSKDTIKAYSGSTVELKLYGLLLDKVMIDVSRGTYINLESIPLTNDSVITLHARNAGFIIPVQILEDKLPKIQVIQNTRDTLRIAIKDDFGVTQVAFNDLRSEVSQTELFYSLVWGTQEEMKLVARDTKNQFISRTIRRPRKTSKEILAEVSKVADRVQPFSSEEIEKINSEERKSNKKRQAQEEKIEELKKKLALEENNKKIDKKKPTTKELDKLLKQLDEQWKAEQLLEVLEQVDTAANTALDSAIMELSEELSDSKDEDLKEAAESAKQIPSEGDQRKKQAKDAAKKLKEALAEAQASVSEDNVERIKRLLKSSWAVSMFQENLHRSTEVQNIKFQRNLMRLEEQVLDSLELLIVSDPALSMALGEASADFSKQLASLKSEFIDKGLESVSIGYVVNALNEIDKVLYFILESEKQSLAAAKKKCKKGQPGQQGKPSAAGSGDKGKKGKKPGEGDGKNGRKPGKTGGKRPSKQGEPQEGENGEGTSSKLKENLKTIDEALKAVRAGGNNPALEQKLERLKKELLFDSAYEDFKMDNFERRLWEATKSIFEKEQQGKERQSNESADQRGNTGQEVKVIIEKRGGSALPLPVLKQTKGDR